MSANFAGSQFVDERRRRRLATEADMRTREVEPATQDPESMDAAIMEMLQNDTPDVIQQAAAREFPIRKILSAKWWKHSLIALFVLSCTGGILALGQQIEQASDVNPGLGRLFSLRSGTVIPFVSSLMLIVAAQLSLLTFWVRSRSTKDFNGRYKLWLWMTGGWLTAAFIIGTDAHIAWFETYTSLWDFNFWNSDVLCWMAPMFGAGIVLLAFLHREMRGCPLSLSLTWLAAMAWVTAGLQKIDIHLVEVPAKYAEVFTAGLQFGGVALAFLSMLIHARYVVYVTNEPAMRALLGQLFGSKASANPKAKKKAKRVPQPSLVESETGTVTIAEIVNADSDAEASPSQTEEFSEEVDADEPVVHDESTENTEPVEVAVEDAMPGEEPDVIPVSSQVEAEPQYDFDPDEPIDPNMLKGLSKRERRRVRKQWREQQRERQKTRRKAG